MVAINEPNLMRRVKDYFGLRAQPITIAKNSVQAVLVANLDKQPIPVSPNSLNPEQVQLQGTDYGTKTGAGEVTVLTLAGVAGSRNKITSITATCASATAGPVFAFLRVYNDTTKIFEAAWLVNTAAGEIRKEPSHFVFPVPLTGGSGNAMTIRVFCANNLDWATNYQGFREYV